ncbi:MAG: ABC transporter permease [Clostridia bacterium]|nr:ABC transporter permease [Clostridia bacterium]
MAATSKRSNRMLLFAGRVLKEILRDPLSFIFCLGVPLVLLLAMYFLFSPTAPWFELEFLTPGIAVFSGTFTMLYMTLLVSRDRSTWFLMRLYTSPMKDADFVLGYALSGVLVGMCQVLICWLTAVVVGLCAGNTGWISWRILPAALCILPMIAGFVAVGILFGSLFSDKAAPGLSSIVISGAGFLSGAWMPIETLSEGFQSFCAALPFYPAVQCGRCLLVGKNILGEPMGMDVFRRHFVVTVIYAVVLTVCAVLAFKLKARREAD